MIRCRNLKEQELYDCQLECACREKKSDIFRTLSGLLFLCCLLLCGCTAADPGAGNKEEETIQTDADKGEEEIRTDTNSGEEEKTGKAALKELMSDAGVRKCVWKAAGLQEEDGEQAVIRKLSECENLVLKESYGEAIYSLEDLRLLPNLRYLVIDFNSWDDSAIEDFSPIGGLSELERLYISYSGEETDLSFLAEMHTITELFLPNCRIKDIAFLAKMPQLQRLSLYGTPVKDLSVLEKLPGLVELTLAGNAGAEHMEAVGTLTKMEDLGLQDCGIEDIGFLEGLKELRGVNLNGNSITDISPLKGMVHLERLGLSENKIEDISVLAGMPELFDLALNSNQVSDLSPLSGLAHLNQVGLSDNRIWDLTPLTGKAELMYAYVSENPIQDLNPVLEVPLLYFQNWGVDDKDLETVSRFMEELCPQIIDYICVDYTEGDLDGNGLTDIAFVIESEQFDGEWEDLYGERCLFILLQRKKGSFERLEDVPSIEGVERGGMRGDPYMGIFMGKGYFVKKFGWGSRDGCTETEIYGFSQGKLELSRHIFVYDDKLADGYDVDIQEGDVWKGYLIAYDDYRLVKMVLGSSEDPCRTGFPMTSLYDMSFYIYHEKIQTDLQPAEALELFRLLVPKAVREELEYADWQKENYELLFGVELPEYYYVVPGDEDSDYFYYNGVTVRDGEYHHRIQFVKNGERKEYLIQDTTGEIKDS